MTRFSLSMNDALDFILKTVELSRGSEVFIPKARAYSILDVKHALEDLIGKHGEDIIGIRPGEKQYEELLTAEEGVTATKHQRIFVAQLEMITQRKLLAQINELRELAKIVPTLDSFTQKKTSHFSKFIG